MEPDRRANRNCDGVTNPARYFEWAPGLDRCPWSQIDDDVWEAIVVWWEWKKFGVLPIDGAGLLGQDAIVFEVIQACEEVVDSEQSRIRKRQEREAKKQHQEMLRVLQNRR